MASQWADAERVIEPYLVRDALGTVIISEAGDIIKNEGGLRSDYGYIFISNPPAGIERAQQIILELDVTGEPIRVAEWHRAVEQTGPMQLTVSNGFYANGARLNLPVTDRQINVTADPIYDMIIEIKIIKNDATLAFDVAYCINGALIAAGWLIVQTLLSAMVPAGTTNIANLGLI